MSNCPSNTTVNTLIQFNSSVGADWVQGVINRIKAYWTKYNVVGIRVAKRIGTTYNEWTQSTDGIQYQTTLKTLIDEVRTKLDQYKDTSAGTGGDFSWHPSVICKYDTIELVSIANEIKDNLVNLENVCWACHTGDTAPTCTACHGTTHSCPSECLTCYSACYAGYAGCSGCDGQWYYHACTTCDASSHVIGFVAYTAVCGCFTACNAEYCTICYGCNGYTGCSACHGTCYVQGCSCNTTCYGYAVNCTQCYGTTY